MSWTIDRHDRVAVVTMSTNPVNAQNRAFFTDLHDAFDRLESEHADSPVVLTGQGQRFSAGLDLGEHFPLFAGPPEGVRGLVRRVPGHQHAPVHLPPAHRRRGQRPRLRRRPDHLRGLRPPDRRRHRRAVQPQRGPIGIPMPAVYVRMLTTPGASRPRHGRRCSASPSTRPGPRAGDVPRSTPRRGPPGSRRRRGRVHSRRLSGALRLHQARRAGPRDARHRRAVRPTRRGTPALVHHADARHAHRRYWQQLKGTEPTW